MRRTFGGRVLGSARPAPPRLRPRRARARPGRAPGRRPAGRHRARRARGAAQARPQAASPRCAQQADAEANPLALWVDYWELSNRLNEAQQGELDRLRGALERQLRRGPAAQRLAARARPAPRLGQLRRRVPALSHERRPRGHLLLRWSPSSSPASDVKAAGIAAWMAQRTPTTAAPCSPPSLVDAKQLTSRRHLEKLRLAAEAGKPRAARQAAVLLGPSVAASVGEMFDSPAPLPRQEGADRAPRRRRARRPGADPRSPRTTASRPPACWSTAGSARCRADLAAWTWASVGRQSGDQAAARGGRPVPARASAIRRKHERDIELPDDTARLEGARRPARRRRQGALAAGDAGDRRDDAGRAERPGLDLLEGARAAGAGQGLAGRRGADDAQPASCSTGIAGQLNFYGQLAAEDLGQPQALPPQARAADAGRARRGRQPSRASRARWC